MLLKTKKLFKNQFRHLNYYSLPVSIFFIVRKRFNLIFFLTIFLIFLTYTLI